MHPVTNRIITGLNQSIRIHSGSGNLFQKRMSEGLRLLYVIIINHYLWFFVPADNDTTILFFKSHQLFERI